MRFARRFSAATLGGSIVLALAACGNTERSTTAKISGGGKDQFARGEIPVENMQRPIATAPVNDRDNSKGDGKPTKPDPTKRKALGTAGSSTCLDLQAFVASLKKIENRTFIRTTTLVQVVHDSGAFVTGRDYVDQTDPDLLLEAFYSDQSRGEVLPIYESISAKDILQEPEFQVATQGDCSAVGLFETKKTSAASSGRESEQPRPLRSFKVEKVESQLGRAGRSLVLSGVNHREVLVFHVPKSNFGFRVTQFKPVEVTPCTGSTTTPVIVRKTVVYTAAPSGQPPQPMIDQEFLSLLIKMVSDAGVAEPELLAKSKLALREPSPQVGEKVIRYRNQVPVASPSLAWLYNEIKKKERLTKPKSCTPQPNEGARPTPTAPPASAAKH